MRIKILTAFLLILIMLQTVSCAKTEESTSTASALAIETPTAEEASTIETEEAVKTLETTVESIDKSGSVLLSLSASEIIEAGFTYGDVVLVKVGENTYEMPVCSDENDVLNGKKMLCLRINSEKGQNDARLIVSYGDFASETGIAEKEKIEEEPGYCWEYLMALPCKVSVSMKMPGGYFDTWVKRSLKRSNKREDYPILSDEEYANFRELSTTGIGAGLLYRSSSPVNPSYNRSKEADEATRKAGVKTVINLTDASDRMLLYADYSETYYAGTEIFARALSMNFLDNDFENDVKDALRFLIAHDAPYLIHCMEGKDRTGYVCALLECFMGASLDEVIEDYMLSYKNYYGVEKESVKYQPIAEKNIKTTLAGAFRVESIEKIDLQAASAEYFRRIGLEENEIALLREKLS